MPHHYSPDRAYLTELRFIRTLRALNKPLTIFEAVRASNPNATRKRVQELVDAINTSMHAHVLSID